MRIAMIVCSILMYSSLRAQFSFPLFEMYLDLEGEEVLFACNSPLFVESDNQVVVEIEPLVYFINQKMTIVGMAVFLPNYITLKKNARVQFTLDNHQKITFQSILVDKEENVIYSKFKLKDKWTLKDNPIQIITIKWGKYQWTSSPLSSSISTYFTEAMDQEYYQIFSPINRLNPYYYEE